MGSRASQKHVNESGGDEWRLRAGQDHWCLVELRDRAGDMLALTNPIYLQPFVSTNR